MKTTRIYSTRRHLKHSYCNFKLLSCFYCIDDEMVRLLRILQKEIDANWFVVYKPFGIPTMTTKKVTWDVNQTDSVMNRMLLMGYTESMKIQQIMDKNTKNPITTAINESYGDEPSLRVSSSVKPHLTFAPLWNMASDSRGLLPICQGTKSIEFFRIASKCKLVQRSYVILVERNLESITPGTQLPEKLEGYTLRSDQFKSPKGQAPRMEERIYMLFRNKNDSLHPDHPWLSSSQYLSVIPLKRTRQHRGTYFHIKTKLLNQNKTSGHDKKETTRQMYLVNLIEGNEEILRCVFAHYGYPITNDIIYNTEFARERFEKYSTEPGTNLPSVHEEINRNLLEMALHPNESQFLHLGMFCCKATFPDPSDEGNMHQIDRAQSIIESSNGRQPPPFTEHLNSINIELDTPPEFTAWVNQERIPGISAKNGTRPIENFPSLAKKIIDPNFMLETFQPEENEEDTIMVRNHVSKGQIAPSTKTNRILRHRLAQYTPSVDVLGSNPFEKRLPATHRSTLLCRYCGDFHNEQYCPISPVKKHSNDGHEEFYRTSTQQSTKADFCIICGVFGHSFRKCVHSYSRYKTVSSSSADKSEKKQGSFSYKKRQCQICKKLNHIELHCDQRKAPPWGYDELGTPLSNSKFQWKSKRLRRQRAVSVSKGVSFSTD